MKTAEWVMRHGAGRVVLAGRRGQAESTDAILLANLSHTTGCTVEYRALDVTSKNEVAALIQELVSIQEHRILSWPMAVYIQFILEKGKAIAPLH